MRPFYVYLLRCSDGSYYIGQTDSIECRLQQHEAGEVGYTSIRKPVELVWQGEFETREGAIKFEQQIKGWSRAKKEALIAGDWHRVRELAKSKQANELNYQSTNRSDLSLVADDDLSSLRPESVDALRQAQGERKSAQTQGRSA